MGLLRPAGPRLALAVLASVVAELSALGLMATAAWVLARAAQRPPVEAITLAVVSVRAFALARGGFRYVERLLSHDAALRALADLRVRVFRALAGRTSGGPRGPEALSRLVADAEAVQDLVLRCIVPGAVGLVASLAAVAVAAALLPAAGLVLALGLLLVGAVAPALTAWTTARHARRAAPIRDRLAVQHADLLHGAADLAVSGATDAALAAAGRTAADAARLERRAGALAATWSAVGVAVQGLVTVGVTALALHAASQGRIDRPLVAVLALVALVAFEPVAPLTNAARHAVELREAARRVLATLDLGESEPEPEPESEPERPAGSAVPDGPPPPAIELEGVRVRYAGRPSLALDVSLRLEPGRRTVLVGASGAGKSTLVATLLRLVEPEAGRVLVGGRDLGGYPEAELRRTVGAVTQDAHVFHVTLRENLLLAKPSATEAELREACRAAGLLDWIDTLADGLDTPAGENGARLSGGQRRRLALARVLLADPPVLLLDEPTEGLPADVADALLADALAAAAGRTTLLVTHRLAGLDPADEVIVLDSGRVAERGPHAELSAGSGRYAELVREAGNAEGPSGGTAERAARERPGEPLEARL
ncbi:thiol reductant ABC exporter subunit CydC [Actinomadura rupiterrae]|uniref:thiol reductant ABC exporter subunit CydC n=1 Tax=Actinomadura rupiterrae TaxID=559627 RepID=UPI0020A55B56|nr:thiol reductant ABC exporter subunit CydC [Actinomadura rupiterrae]MCP2341070.1 ATP-binding cassette subfamily C protein/ATP-binding cassette subfamily C protein CydC/ATP-binding cassette subfamily C protein CydCD [Actinomadura rupiterrae]